MAHESERMPRRPRSLLNKLVTIVTSKWFVGSAMIGGFVYAVVRALIASPALAIYGVNVWIFLAIDVLTVPPYIICINRTIRQLGSASCKGSVINGLGVALSFVAPYAYISVAGGAAMSPWAIVVFVLIIATFAVLGPIRTIVARLRKLR